MQRCSLQAWFPVGICSHVHTELIFWMSHKLVYTLLLTCMYFLTVMSCHISMCTHPYAHMNFLSSVVCQCVCMCLYSCNCQILSHIGMYTHVHMHEIYDHHPMVISIYRFKGMQLLIAIICWCMCLCTQAVSMWSQVSTVMCLFICIYFKSVIM